MAFLGAASWSGRTSAAAYAAALAVAVLAAAAAVPGSRADFSSDRAECADKLVGMMTCLAYVQGAAAAPTPDCCTGLKQVLQTSKKCLCVLIKDRDDPNLGFKINATRALALPDVCKASANISECPKLLNLNSTEAQIFDQFVKEHGAQSSPSSGAGLAGAGGQKSGVGAGKKWLLGLRVDKVGATFFCLVYLIVSIFVIVG